MESGSLGGQSIETTLDWQVQGGLGYTTYHWQECWMDASAGPGH